MGGIARKAPAKPKASNKARKRSVIDTGPIGNKGKLLTGSFSCPAIITRAVKYQRFYLPKMVPVIPTAINSIACFMLKLFLIPNINTFFVLDMYAYVPDA